MRGFTLHPASGESRGSGGAHAIPISRRVAAAAAAALAVGPFGVGLWQPSPVSAATPPPYIAYVANSGANTVTPFNVATKAKGTPITVGTTPVAVAITPDASTVYAVNSGSSSVTPITTATNTAGTAIAVGSGPSAIAITPDGSTAYVVNTTDGTLTPIATATNTAGTAFAVGTTPVAIAITPDGQTAYVATDTFPQPCVIPVNLATRTPGACIGVDINPAALAITPDGSTLYLVHRYNNDVTSINTATNHIRNFITVGYNPQSVAITPDGATAYVTNENDSTITPIDTATDTVGTAFDVLGDPGGIAITPDGSTGYTTHDFLGYVNPFDVAGNWSSNVGGFSIGSHPRGIAITPDQAPTARLSVTAWPTGVPTVLDASASTVPYTSIASYRWNFGDGSAETTTTSATTTHVYASPGAYTASVTETSSLGTSTSTQVFTGQTMLRHGGPQAQAQSTFTVTAPPIPTVSGVSPSSGPAFGGTTVTVSGSGFFGANAVSFGTTPAIGYHVVNDTQLTAVSPSGSGTVDVTVASASGTSPTSAVDHFTYAAPSSHHIAYVTNSGSNTVTPVDVSTNVLGAPIAVGANPFGVAITPDAGTAYVTNRGAGTVSVIDTASNHVTATVTVGGSPTGVAITPDGSLVLVANYGSNTVTPITVSGNAAGTPISVGTGPYGIAITPDGATAYVTNNGDGTVTPITVATGTPGTAISVGANPEGIAITPDGATAWVANSGSNTLTPITVASNTAGTALAVASHAHAIAITPDGTKAFFTDWLWGVRTLNLATNAMSDVGSLYNVDTRGITVAPGGGTAYLVNHDDSYNRYVLWPIDVGSNNAGSQVVLGTAASQNVAITPDQAPVAALSVTARPVGMASTFDASASTVKYGSITYTYDFGDGSAPLTTSASSTTHTYTAVGSYTATVTEKSSAGTSTAKVFTGQTMSRNGGSQAQASSSFSIGTMPVPTVRGLSPTSGPWTGATTVTISGSGFSFAGAVHFGSSSAASFSITDDGEISAVSPAGSGPVHVTVTNSQGTSATGDADLFTYIPPPAPTVSAVSPSSGPTVGGTAVTITGTGFVAVSGVSFGGTPAASYTVTNSTHIAAVSPARSGTVDVTVTNLGGTSATSAADVFTYGPAVHVAYVGNGIGRTITPIDTLTKVVGAAMPVPPSGLAITPDGRTLYVAYNEWPGAVKAIDIASGQVTATISGITGAGDIAISPDGSTAYVIGLSTITPIEVATNTTGTAMIVNSAGRMAITPDGTTALVTGYYGTVTAVNLATQVVGSSVNIGGTPFAIAITPDGLTALVTDDNGNWVTPVDIPSMTVGTRITVGWGGEAVAITPDGSTAFVTSYYDDTVTPVDLSTHLPGTAIAVGSYPTAISVTPDGKTLYVADSAGNTVTPVDVATRTPGANLPVGAWPYAVVITPDQAPVAHLSVTAAPPGSATSFDASASTVAIGSIASYKWTFGDGSPAETTATPTTTHVYAAAGNYTASVIETSSAGTSTAQVFTGQTVARNGGPQAEAQASVNIGKAGTTTSVAPASPTTVYGQAQTFTATVTPTGGSATPTGTVQFTVDGSNFGAAQTLDGSGVATLSINGFPPGGHIVAASYSGDDSYTGSTAGGRVWQVNKATTAVTVASDTNPADPGVPVTFTATVTPVAPATGQPTGWVTFWDNSATHMVALHADGTATWTTTTLTPGTHSIIAQYHSDTNFYGNYSSTLSQVITAIATTTVVATSDANAVTGEPLTFTATVTPVSGGGTPTGTVQFSVDGTAVGGPQAMSGGAASISGVALTHTGSPHTIAAAYSGGGGFAAGTGSYSQAVDRADTAVAVVSSANPSVFGQAVSFTATVSASSPGGGTPGGTVQFYVDGSPLGSPVTLNGAGQATSTSTSFGLSGGSITADYSGSTDYNAGSGTVSQIVNQAESLTSVVLNVNPSVFGQAVTFTATVAAKSPGAGTPTGSVQFSVDGVSVGSPVALDGTGHATTPGISTLTRGAHAIAAVYGGDTHFGSSTAAAVTQDVYYASTDVVVDATPYTTVYGQPVHISAVVSATAPGAGTPSGTVVFYDAGSAIGSTTLASDGTAFIDVSSFALGNHPLSAAYTGDGSFFAGASTTLVHLVEAARSATVVTSSLNPSVYGQTVTFTATVSAVAPGSGTPTGVVHFIIDGDLIGTPVPLVGGTASVQMPVETPGYHAVIAAYGPDGNFLNSLSGLTQVVRQAETVVTVHSSVNPSVTGQDTTVSATVGAAAPGAGLPTGTVQFSVDGVAAAPVALDASGHATLGAVSFATAVTHSLTARYNGDSNFKVNVGALDQVVTPASTATVVSTGDNPTVYGQATVFVAQVSAVAPGAGTPTGTAQFAVDGVPVGTPVPLSSSGVAVYGPDGSLGTGLHTLTAVYGGDANFNGSTSPGYAQQVQPAETTTTVEVLVSPSVYRQMAAFRATVAPVAPGAGMPTGLVTFYDNGTALGPAALDGLGNAGYATPMLEVGPHSITAVYASDGNFNGSTSAAASQQVDPADSATVVTSSGTPSGYSHAVTFTATVAAVAPGGGTPAGAVQWSIDGANVGGAVALDGAGQATLTTSSLAAGDHTVRADYADSSRYNGSFGTVTQVVQSAVTATSLASSANPSLTGQSVTFTAHVTGDGTPTGTVQFGIDGSNLGAPVAIDATGYATSPAVSTLSVGGHYVDADYSGDANHLASEGGVTQNVSKATPSVTLSSSLTPSKFGQSVTFTVTVAAVAPATGTPTGTVTFKVNGTVYKTATLSGGSASYSSNALPPGTLSVTAAYGGDSSFNSATGNTVSQQVTFSSNCITSQVKNGLVVNAGQSICVQGTPNKPVSIKGGIVVKPGGALFLSNVNVQGGIVSSGATAFRMCNSSEGSGSVSITGSTGLVVFGDKGDDGTPVCGNNSISGGVNISGNNGGVEIGGNTVSGGLTVNNNSGPTPPDATTTEIEGNTVSGGLFCNGNSPAPSNGGYPNRVTSGPRTGQCVASTF